MRSPTVFAGYYKDEAATREVLDEDGWLRTGDVAAIDDDGFYAIVGRVKDVIRTGGETVAPVEVELALADHPALVDVAVVGIPDPQWGEIVCAAVVVRDGADAPDVDALRIHVGDRLARFKHPRMVVVVDLVPRTPATRQVQRRLLIEEITSNPGS
jgi:acyl-CoA synthetase (AMP-forming)/AMP-acid ligase II